MYHNYYGVIWYKSVCSHYIIYIYTQFAVQSIKRHNYKNTTNKSRLAPHKLTMTTMVMLLVCVAVSCVRAESSTRTLGPGGGGTPI